MSMEFAGRVKGHYYGLSKTEKKNRRLSAGTCGSCQTLFHSGAGWGY